MNLTTMVFIENVNKPSSDMIKVSTKRIGWKKGFCFLTALQWAGFLNLYYYTD